MIDFNKRVTTSFNLSIGTGLMMESLFTPTHPRYDKDREIPNIIDLSKYHFHFVNILTLARNIYQSIEPRIDIDVVLKDRGFISCLLKEMVTMDSLYRMISTNLVFYYNDYEKLHSLYNINKTREDTSPVSINRKIYKVIKGVNFKSLLPKDCKILENIIKIPKIESRYRSIMTTHITCDLCCNNDVYLLDSHTGVLYDRRMFYKKYNGLNNKDMSVLPMNEKLLYLFGDKNLSLLISPSIRLLIHAYAVENKWNYLTSNMSVEKMISNSKELKELIKKFKPIY